MDAGIDLVEAYLHVNGYLTVTEFPIVEALEGGGFRMVTDVDVLAVRLPGAGRIVTPEHGDAARQRRLWDPDPRLLTRQQDDCIDFIIAEVKEGRAELNRGARRVETIIAAMRRFTRIEPDLALRLARQLLRKGRAEIPDKHVQVRLFAFGSRRSDRPGTPNVILLEDCLAFLVNLWTRCAPLTTTVQAKHPVASLLGILSKAGYLKGKVGGR